ncbi:pilus assembly protein CpaE [Sphingobium faniae]|nr:pilus assembly protein CpaE [Sphingobium faniae]
MGIGTKAGEPDIWTLDSGRNGIDVVLSEEEVRSSDLTAGEGAGQVLRLTMLAADRPLPPALIEQARAVLLEVSPDSIASMERLKGLRRSHPDLPIVAAVRDASLPVMRELLRGGVADVVSLPLRADELTNVLRDLAALLEKRQATVGLGQLITSIKTVGGVGATTILTQMASLDARSGAATGRRVCLIDLDVQFGNAATYLGVDSPLTLRDLLAAGNRVDAELLRTVAVQTRSGLNLITAPNDIMPLEAVDPEQIYRIIDLARQEYDAVYLDLPGNWTNWSLSLVARSDILLLIVELSIASLRQARRQIALLRNEGINPTQLHVVANRVEKRLFRAIGLEEAEKALDQPIEFSIANDFPLVNSALDQGVLIEDLKAKSRVCKDFQALVESCVAQASRGEQG